MKIEQQELTQLQELQNKYQSVIIKLGEISSHQILLKEQKHSVKKSLSEIQDEEKILKQFLIQKYGDNLDINIETGEY